MVFTMVSGYGGSQKVPIFETYVCMFGPETMVNIVQIRFYIQSLSPPKESKGLTCDLDLYVCMFVCMDV